MRSGLPNAIRVANEMEARGHKLKAIRLDSGDLANLSKRARALLDSAKLHYVQIVVSNQLDEILISSLIQQGAPIDAFGIGTRLFNCLSLSGFTGYLQAKRCRRPAYDKVIGQLREDNTARQEKSDALF